MGLVVHLLVAVGGGRGAAAAEAAGEAARRALLREDGVGDGGEERGLVGGVDEAPEGAVDGWCWCLVGRKGGGGGSVGWGR